MSAKPRAYAIDTVVLYELVQVQRAALANLSGDQDADTAPANRFLNAAFTPLLDEVEASIKAGAGGDEILSGVISVIASALELVGDGFAGSYQDRTRALNLVASLCHGEAQDGLTRGDIVAKAPRGSRAVQ